MARIPDSIRLPALKKATASVIFVHGLGDTGNGWKSIAELFRQNPKFSHVRWVLPHSPIQKVTANGGVEMPSWFDIQEFGLRGSEDQNGMLQSAMSLQQLITREIDEGIPSERIVLGGFSQGAVMSLLSGLTGERKLAGIVALSGWVPLRHQFAAMASTHAKRMPIFFGHGDQDPLIQREVSTSSIEILTSQLGVQRATEDSVVGLTYHVYRGLAHGLDESNELPDLIAWLGKVLPPVKEAEEEVKQE
ncbi:lysophospholipase I [Flagelloscypha sp. PMI_526]|nr:lysophospholipase I [Flagelloscypha sp. PMI_526]